MEEILRNSPGDGRHSCRMLSLSVRHCIEIEIVAVYSIQFRNSIEANDRRAVSSDSLATRVRARQFDAVYFFS